MQGNTDATDESHRTRRSVLRVGALASGGLMLGLPTRVGALDRNGETTRTSTEYRGRIYASDFYPHARFRVASEPLDYKPNVPVQEGEAFLADLYWNDYGTRIVRYENTDERVLFFPPLDAPIDRGERYRTGRIRSTDELADGIVSVGFSQVAGADGTEE